MKHVANDFKNINKIAGSYSLTRELKILVRLVRLVAGIFLLPTL
jgi:hypothetical protein